MPDENKPQGNSEWLETYNLALEDRVQCDSEECENPATVFVQVKCCGAVMLSCEACMRKAQRLVVWMVHNRRIIQCEGCGTKNHPAQWMGEVQKL